MTHIFSEVLEDAFIFSLTNDVTTLDIRLSTEIPGELLGDIAIYKKEDFTFGEALEDYRINLLGL